MVGADRKLLDQTGAHGFIHRRVLDRCYCFGFSATPYHSFPILLHIDNVNASQVSEEGSIRTTRRFLARTIASTLPTTAAISAVTVYGAHAGVTVCMSIINV